MDKPALAKRRLLIMSKLQTPCISEILVVEEQCLGTPDKFIIINSSNSYLSLL